VFEITAVGKANAGLEERMPEIIVGLGMAVLNGSERIRPSSAGNFVSISVTFTCPSREMYEAAHAALRADPAVKWTL
jgi:putative lipoic acid-binding regulatory protein